MSRRFIAPEKNHPWCVCAKDAAGRQFASPPLERETALAHQRKLRERGGYKRLWVAQDGPRFGLIARFLPLLPV